MYPDCYYFQNISALMPEKYLLYSNILPTDIEILFLTMQSEPAMQVPKAVTDCPSGKDTLGKHTPTTSRANPRLLLYSNFTHD